jgi:hypothetical protein
MLLHRLDPAVAAAADPRGTHPSDAARAAVVLEVLRLLTKVEPSISRYKTTCSLLSKAWTALQQSAPAEAHLTEPELAAVKVQARIALQFLDEKLERIRYEWPTTEVHELAEALEQDREPRTDLTYCIRDVLNAAWMLRLNSWVSGNALPAHVQQRGRQVIAEIERKPVRNAS